MLYQFKYLLFLLAVLLFNCKSVDEKFSSTLNKKLVLLNTYSLSVPEPSGLCFDNITNSLWTVSDSTGKIYNLKLNGELIREISLSGSLDLEGVCLNFSGNFLFVVNEQIREIIKVSLSGTTESRKQILEGNDNIGLEGICTNPANGHFFVVKEKSPGMLIELSSGLNILNQKEITFADDFSGMTWDTNNNQLIIISHLSEKIFFYNIDYGVTKSFDINIVQAEGIAIDNNSIIYIVSDSDSKLYVYEFPQSFK